MLFLFFRNVDTWIKDTLKKNVLLLTCLLVFVHYVWKVCESNYCTKRHWQAVFSCISKWVWRGVCWWLKYCLFLLRLSYVNKKTLRSSGDSTCKFKEPWKSTTISKNSYKTRVSDLYIISWFLTACPPCLEILICFTITASALAKTV